MKRSRFTLIPGMAFLLVMVACVPASATSVPASALMPTLSPASGGGPEMVVGSAFLYVDGTSLVPVPAGQFTMGNGGVVDHPEHMVTLSGFWIYSTKITNQQYGLCVKNGGCTAPDPTDNPAYDQPQIANRPVVGVTYDQAVAYCTYVHARLPTEAEWEKTARGPKADIYPWGNEVATCDLLNYNSCVGRTTDVTAYPQGRSYYQALDMAGNANEWVADWYDANYYLHSPSQNPTGPETGDVRAVRSSSYTNDDKQVPVYMRFSAKPVDHRSDLGFRCVVTEPKYFAQSCQRVTVYGLGPDGKPDPVDFPISTCPSVSITQGPYCESKTAKTTVTFKGPAGAAIDSDSCIKSSDPRVFTCLEAKAVSICAACSLTFPADSKPGCPSGWHTVTSGPLAGEACEPDSPGTPGKCLPGINYDPVNQCCTAAPGVDTPSTVCPVGTYYVEKINACVPAPVAGGVCEKQTVSLKICGKPGGPGGCDQNKVCPNGWSLDVANCCCMDANNTCH
jgi:sulfatase modifying factor 1